MLQATPSNPTAAAQINTDGHADVKGSDWGVGYQLAWMWDINDRARVGVNYRSKVSHTLKGDAEWAADGAAAKQQWNDNMLTPLGYTANEKARVKIVTPESLSVHGMYKVSDKADLFGDVTWTRHSRFNKAELFFEKEKILLMAKNPTAPPSPPTGATPTKSAWAVLIKSANRCNCASASLLTNRLSATPTTA